MKLKDLFDGSITQRSHSNRISIKQFRDRITSKSNCKPVSLQQLRAAIFDNSPSRVEDVLIDIGPACAEDVD